VSDPKIEMCEVCEALLNHQGIDISSITKGAIMSTGNSLFRSPWLWFAVGAAAGYYGYKHRKEFAGVLAKAGDMGKDFVQQGKENLEDLLEEARENEEAMGGEGSEAAAETK
jgi:ElaB/YqjD/DUF883 family membrane-anchored ribosome-binding protein